MSRGKRGFLSFVAALATVTAATVAPVAAVETDGAVAGSDNLAPEPVTNLQAFPGASGVEVSWDLSVSDVVRQSPTGTDVSSGGSFVSVNDVAGYNIWRNGEMIDTVPAGEMIYVDALAAGSSLIYEVSAVDAAGNEILDGIESVVVTLGPPPTADVTTNDLIFGAFAADEFDTQSITVANLATDPEAILVATAVTLDGASGFSVEPASVTVDAEGSAAFLVTFDAAAVDNINGDYSDTVRVRTNDPDAPEYKIAAFASVTGGIGAQEIQLSRGEIIFGQVDSSSAARTVQVVISNVGGLPLTVSTSFTNPSPAITAAHLTDAVIEAGSSAILGVSIDPKGGLGQKQTTLVIASDDPVRPTISLQVTATVVGVIKAANTKTAQVVRQSVRFPAIVRTPSLPSFALDTSDPVAVSNFITAPAFVTQRSIFLADFRFRIARLMAISISRILNLRMAVGSLNVTYDIAPPPAGSTEPTATEAATTVSTALADTATSNDLTDFGTTDTTAPSESVQQTIYPVTSEGNVVVGWFSQDEDQVGLASFFLFADNYGKSSGGPDFDDTYDIAPTDAPDGVVGLEDFFLFADNYGKVVENAAIIRGL